jgi:hypothetical protein
VSPDDLEVVERSWAELAPRRDVLLEHLAATLEVEPELVESRARWLLAAVAELVELLPTPSRLGARARSLAASWPCPCALPTFGVDGRAFLRAAKMTSAAWTPRTDRAWRHAWLLLADELAEQSLSPFAGPVEPRRGPDCPPDAAVAVSG